MSWQTLGAVVFYVGLLALVGSLLVIALAPYLSDEPEANEHAALAYRARKEQR